MKIIGKINILIIIITIMQLYIIQSHTVEFAFLKVKVLMIW